MTKNRRALTHDMVEAMTGRDISDLLAAHPGMWMSIDAMSPDGSVDLRIERSPRGEFWAFLADGSRWLA